MIIYSATDFKTLPWKNGKGTTTELIRLPHQADLTDFDLRISIADVNSDGEFSPFPDHVRWISVLEGNYFLLSHNNSEMVRVNQSDLHFFSGSDSTFCRTDGQILKDFNVIVSKQVAEKVQVFFSPENFTPKPNHVYFVYIIDGNVTLSSGKTISDHHLLQLSSTEFQDIVFQPSRFFLIESVFLF